MVGHDICFFEVFGDHWSTHFVLGDSAHIPDSVNFLDVQVVQFFEVLFELWLGQPLFNLESESIIINFNPRTPEDDAMLEEFVLWMFFGEVCIFRCLF